MRERAEVLEMLRKKKALRQEALRKQQEEAHTEEPSGPTPTVDEFGEVVTSLPTVDKEPEVEEEKVIEDPPEELLGYVPAEVVEDKSKELVLEVDKMIVEGYAMDEEDKPVANVCKAGTMTVSKQFTEAGKILHEDNRSEQLDVRVFQTEPAYAKFGGGNTVNLGDYNGARIYIEVSVPCYLEELPSAMQHAKAFVTSVLDEEMAELVQ
jgi:hypothetical protein